MSNTKRICDLAQPGQVLVSETVCSLLVGSGIEFQDRGEHELKGVPGLWRLYAPGGLTRLARASAREALAHAGEHCARKRYRLRDRLTRRGPLGPIVPIDV